MRVVCLRSEPRIFGGENGGKCGGSIRNCGCTRARLHHLILIIE